MGMSAKRAYLECCGCRNGCIGCCLPISDNPAPYDVVMVPIPWFVSAPYCSSIDGRSGEFIPVDPTAPGIGPCGYCMTYCDIGGDFVDIPGIAKIDMGFMCMTTPCGFGHLKLILECNNDSADSCCARLRLWVGMSISSSTLVGGTAETPPALCGVNDGYSWYKLSPVSCTCEGGMSAEFDLSVISIECNEFWGPGACVGQPRCCQIGCTLTDAIIVI